MAEKKPMSEARRAANKRWNDANLKERYDRVQLVLPKGDKERIREYADRNGDSLNAYIIGEFSSEWSGRTARGQETPPGVVLVSDGAYFFCI